MTTLVLTDRDVRALLTVRECIDVMAGAFSSLAKGDAVQPLRTVVRVGEGPNAFASMPAVVGTGVAASLGAKVITVFPGNDATPYDSHIGVVLLFDAEFGRLLALADASSITAIRTAAVSGLATRLLSREDAETVAILGAGVLALPHLEAMCAVRPIRRATIWSPSAVQQGSRAMALAAAARDVLGVSVEVCDSVESAVRAADIVCTLTASRTPVLHGNWLREGTHVNAVGASIRTARELDSATVQRAEFFADRRESVLAESGDFLIPLSEGLIDERHLRAELAELVTGTHAGRSSRAALTVFKSLGLAIEDVAALRHIHTRASERGVGLSINLGGLRH
jgi:ornithine cyclodeaminase